MALTDIIENILADAQKQSENIISLASLYAKEAEDIISAEIASKEKAEKDIAKRTLSDHARKFDAGIEHRKKILVEEAKRNLIDSVFEQALTSLCKLAREDYTALLTNILKRIPDIGISAECVAPNDRIDETKIALKEAGMDYDVKATEDFTGGCVIKTSTAEFDMRFERIIIDKKRELETEVSNILFSV